MSRRVYHKNITSFEAAAEYLIKHNSEARKLYSGGHFLVHKLKHNHKRPPSRYASNGYYKCHEKNSFPTSYHIKRFDEKLSFPKFINRTQFYCDDWFDHFKLKDADMNKNKEKTRKSTKQRSKSQKGSAENTKNKEKDSDWIKLNGSQKEQLKCGLAKYGITVWVSHFPDKVTSHPFIEKFYETESDGQKQVPVQQYRFQHKNEVMEQQKIYPIIHIPIYSKIVSNVKLAGENQPTLKYKYFLNYDPESKFHNMMDLEFNCLFDLIDYYRAGGNGDTYIKNYINYGKIFSQKNGQINFSEYWDSWEENDESMTPIPEVSLKYPMFNFNAIERKFFFHSDISSIHDVKLLMLPDSIAKDSWLLRYHEKNYDEYVLSIKIKSKKKKKFDDDSEFTIKNLVVKSIDKNDLGSSSSESKNLSKKKSQSNNEPVKDAQKYIFKKLIKVEDFEFPDSQNGKKEANSKTKKLEKKTSKNLDKSSQKYTIKMLNAIHSDSILFSQAKNFDIEKSAINKDVDVIVENCEQFYEAGEPLKLRADYNTVKLLQAYDSKLGDTASREEVLKLSKAEGKKLYKSMFANPSDLLDQKNQLNESSSSRSLPVRNVSNTEKHRKNIKTNLSVRPKSNLEKHRENTKASTWKQVERVAPDFPKLLVDEFEFVKQHAIFDAMEHESHVPMRSKNGGLSSQNANKNRYRNILPYDNSRIILRYGDRFKKNIKYKEKTRAVFDIDADQSLKEDNTYVNASSIPAWGNQNRGRNYIATQGPLVTSRGVSTILDFWRLMATSASRLIVMVTKCFENGKPKVQQYWPNIGEELKVFSNDKAQADQEIFTISNEEEIWVLTTSQTKESNEDDLDFPDHSESGRSNSQNQNNNDPGISEDSPVDYQILRVTKSNYGESLDKYRKRVIYKKRRFKVKAHLNDQVPINLDRWNLYKEHNGLIVTNQRDKKYAWHVYQFQYTAWPDHGVPDKPEYLLKFILDTRKFHYYMPEFEEQYLFDPTKQVKETEKTEVDGVSKIDKKRMAIDNLLLEGGTEIQDDSISNSSSYNKANDELKYTDNIG